MPLNLPPDYPDSLRTLGAVVYDGLIARGIDDTAATDVSQQVIDEVVQVFGGQPIYWPKLAHHQAKRNAAIFDAYNGHNKEALARQYDITPRRIEVIIAAEHARRRAESQGNLPL